MDYNKKYTIFKNKISKKTGKNLEFTGTLKEISNRYNLNYATLYNRITKMYLSIEEAILYKNKVYYYKNKFDKNGNKIYKYNLFLGTDKEFHCDYLLDISKQFNIPYNTLVYRIHDKNLSIECAINTKDNRSNKIYVVFKGVHDNKYNLNEFAGNLYQISKHFNIPYNTLKSCINKQHLTVEKAILKSFK